MRHIKAINCLSCKRFYGLWIRMKEIFIRIKDKAKKEEKGQENCAECVKYSMLIDHASKLSVYNHK